MVDSFEANAGSFRVVKNDDIAFDSERPSIQLLPDAYKVSISATVTFPNLLQGPAYLQRTYGSTPYCESWSALFPQEWGPDESNSSPTDSLGALGIATRYLAEEYLGEVSALADYIDVRAKITRTTTPPTFMQQYPPPVMFKEGEWFGLPGGSCPCEYFVPLARHFDIALRGTSLYLRRFQSVRNNGVLFSWGSNPTSQYGWFTTIATAYGVSYAGAFTRYGTPAVLIDTQSGDITKNRRAPWSSYPNGSCSITAPDYTSAYSCQFEIRPGRYSAGH